MRVFFTKFFATYPQYLKLPFFISGESYGGRYVPTMSHLILSENKSPTSPDWNVINLRGISIGNGVVDPIYQYPVQGKFALMNKLINDTAYFNISVLERACYNAIASRDWDNADNTCGSIIIQILKYAGDINPMNYKERCPIAECFLYPGIIAFFNDPNTKERLNVPQTTPAWQACNFDVAFSSSDMWESFSSYVAYSLQNNVTVLVYYGDLDCVAPWNGGLAWAENMQWSGQDGFNKQLFKKWIINSASGDKEQTDTVAGVYKSFANFTVLTFYDGGHMTPHDQPSNSLELFSKFTQQQPWK